MHKELPPVAPAIEVAALQMIVITLVHLLAAERGGTAWIDQIIVVCDKLFRNAASTSNSEIDSDQFRADAAARVKTILKGSPKK